MCGCSNTYSTKDYSIPVWHAKITFESSVLVPICIGWSQKEIIMSHLFEVFMKDFTKIPMMD